VRGKLDSFVKNRHARPRFRGDKLAPVKTGGGYPGIINLLEKTGFPFARNDGIFRQGMVRRTSFAGCSPDQCLKCRIPVMIMAMPCSFAASITSSSLRDPPGWITAVMPACLANLSSPDFQRLILYNIEIGLLYFDASTINQNPGIGLNHD